MTEATGARPRLMHPEDGEALWFLGSLVTVKAAAEDTSGRCSVVEFVNPAGFATPLHRHLREDEMFFLLEGTATFRCDDVELDAAPGDFVLLPVGLPHAFWVTSAEPLRTLQITVPGGFERFAADVGRPATERRLPDAGPLDPAALGHAAAMHGMEILGPPPGPQLAGP
jgi:mannose-6-phosphate isomerase-like protein (cupin superfamily)